MIRALFKFAKIPNDAVVIDTTSNSGDFRELSPFVLPAPPAQSAMVEGGILNIRTATTMYKKPM